MENVITEKALSLSDSVYLVLLIGLATGTWWLIRWILKKNDERETRYIQTIDRLAQVEGIKTEISALRKEVKDNHDDTKKMLGRVLDRLPAKGVD